MSKVNAVPDGMHSVTPHLVCAGAAAAIDFYKKAFGATEVARLPGPDGKLTIHLYVADVDAFVARAVEAGADVIMPIDDMFWGDPIVMGVR